MRKDPRMSYRVVNQTQVDKKQIQKTAMKIQVCIKKHFFDYRPGCEVVFTIEFLCDCENWLDFQFDDCLRKEDLNDESLLNSSVTEEDIVDDDYYLEEN